MQKLIKVIILIAALILMIMPHDSSAVGLGIFIPTVGSGSTTLEIDSPNEFGVQTYEPDISHFGFGFVLDTRVANPGVFHYRLHIGYESVNLGEANFTQSNRLNDNFSRFSIDNTFGFAVLQSEVVRLWLGPQIRLSYMGYNKEESGVNLDVNLIGIGVAPVLGANFNLGDVFTLAPELGYRFSVFGGKLSVTENYVGIDYDYSQDWTLNTREFYIKLNIIFRINDYYF